MREGLTRTFSVDSKTFLLADTDNSYQSHFRPVLPNRTDLAGSDDLAGEPHMRVWRQDDFSGGMGDRIWNAANNGYYAGTVRLTDENALVLPALTETPRDNLDAEVNTVDSVVITTTATGTAAISDGVWAWDSTAAKLRFNEGTIQQLAESGDGYISAGQTGYRFPSIKVNGARAYMGGFQTSLDGNRVIYEVNITPDTVLNSARFNNASATYKFLIWDDTTSAKGAHPVLEVFDGQLFALNGNDLHEVSLSASNTFIPDQAAGILTGSPYPAYTGTDIAAEHDYPLRITATDVGIAYVERWATPNRVRLYNVYTATASVLGILPLGAEGESIYYSSTDDTVWVSVAGRERGAFLYHYGSTSGIVGPFGSGGTYRAILGEYGDSILYLVGTVVYAYDRSTGGISTFAATMPGSNSKPPASVAISPVDASDPVIGVGEGMADSVTFIYPHQYATSATWESGLVDFQYPGLTKVLTEVTIETDPLPASTSVQLSYRADGSDTWRDDTTNLHDSDGATIYRWHMAADGSSAVGKDFEFKLTLSGTVTATPTIRAVSASVTGVERRRQWQLLVDTADHDGGSGAHVQASYSVLADLNTLGNGQAAVTFSNPFEERDSDVNASHTVIVRDVVVGDEGMRADQALLVLEETELYPPSATDFVWDDLQG